MQNSNPIGESHFVGRYQRALCSGGGDSESLLLLLLLLLPLPRDLSRNSVPLVRGSLTPLSLTPHQPAAFFSLSLSLARTPTLRRLMFRSLFLAHAGGVQSLVSNRTFSRQKKIETHTGNLHTLHFFEKFTSNCHSARCLLFDGSGREILVPVPTKDARVVAGSKQSNGNAAPRIKNWIVVVHTHTRPRNSAIISRPTVSTSDC